MSLRIEEPLAAGLARGRPAVALETAVVTHGLPAPRHLEAADAMQAAVREAGALPAVVGVHEGVLRVGLGEDRLRAMAADEDRRKCGPRDLALAIAAGASGGTTVAATLLAARAAGIRVFATGGIGGVHRGDPADVSADLPALGRYPLVVVCSGPKTLLDLRRTREVLETQGVAVLGYGCDRMPAFYLEDSGLPVDARVDGPEEVAEIARARDAVGHPAALLVTLPLPSELALRADEVEAALAGAHALARREGISGAALTPFTLAQLAARTEGRSLEANLALLRRNAELAGRIAVALTEGDPAP